MQKPSIVVAVEAVADWRKKQGEDTIHLSKYTYDKCNEAGLIEFTRGAFDEKLTATFKGLKVEGTDFDVNEVVAEFEKNAKGSAYTLGKEWVSEKPFCDCYFCRASREQRAKGVETTAQQIAPKQPVIDSKFFADWVKKVSDTPVPEYKFAYNPYRPRIPVTANPFYWTSAATETEAVSAPTENNGGEGRKDDAKKDSRPGLIAWEMLDGMGRVLAFGADKYAAGNWAKGMNWSRPWDALQRHLVAWSSGEREDDETGYSHLWHAACMLMFLIAYEARDIGNDDMLEVGVEG